MAKHKNPLSHEEETRKISKRSLYVSIGGVAIALVAALNSCSQSRTASETLKLTQVAYVGVSGVTIIPPHGSWNAGAIAAIANGGNTPASKVQANLHEYVADPKTKISSELLNEGRIVSYNTNTTIQAKSQKNIGYTKISDDDYDSALSSKKILYFYGNFSYKTVLNDVHYGEYCVYSTGISENFATGQKSIITAECPFHNCVDDDCTTK